MLLVAKLADLKAGYLVRMTAVSTAACLVQMKAVLMADLKACCSVV